MGPDTDRHPRHRGRAGTARRRASLGALIVLAPLGFAAAAFYIVGPDRIWTWAGGPADQGKIDFGSLKRRTSPMDSLVCTPSLCNGPSDFALPVYAGPADRLLGLLDAAAEAGREAVTRVDDRSDPSYRRYVARTPVMGFPDTIDVVAAPAEAGIGLAFYSRSLLGSNDVGANRRRLERWTSALRRWSL